MARKSKYGAILDQSVPQTQPLNERQTPNNAGGFAYKTTEMQQLERFLMLGTVGGTYYVGERKLTQQNVNSVISAIKNNGPAVIEKLVEIDVAGRAPKKSPALFTLALATKHGDEPTRKAAYSAIPQVARTGSHLFEFVQAIDDVGKGWGRGLKNAVGNWYKNQKNLGYQLIKYKQRNGYTHRDLLRLTHPQTDSEVVRWAVKGGEVSDAQIQAAEALKTATVDEAVNLVKEHRLPREAIPTTMLNEPKIWKAMLEVGMPMTALIRNLGKMTSVGMFNDTAMVDLVVNQLTNKEILAKARIHPISVMVALKVYSAGRGHRGSLAWTPNSRIVSALSTAFLDSFSYIPKIDKQMLVALDVSGSMSGHRLQELGGMQLHEVSACMSMAMVAANPNTEVVAFDYDSASYYSGVKPSLKVGIRSVDTVGRRLDDVYNMISRIGGGGTDLTLPIWWAMAMKQKPELIVMYTDSESWAGSRHIDQVWADYQKQVPNAKLVIVMMTATNTVAIEESKNVLQVVGFDTSVPQAIEAFVNS